MRARIFINEQQELILQATIPDGKVETTVFH